MINLDTILMEIVIDATADADPNQPANTDYTMDPNDQAANDAGATNQVGNAPPQPQAADDTVDFQSDQGDTDYTSFDSPEPPDEGADQNAGDNNAPPTDPNAGAQPPADPNAGGGADMGGGAPPAGGAMTFDANGGGDADAGGSTDYSSMDPGNIGGAPGGGDAGSPPPGGDMGGAPAGGSGELSPDELKDKDTKVKQLTLLKQMIGLYEAIKNYNRAVINLDKPNVLFSLVQNKVSQNFSKLYNLIYQYITYYFDNMSYEYNLYSYGYFIEACKINIEMLKKILDKDEVKID